MALSLFMRSALTSANRQTSLFLAPSNVGVKVYGNQNHENNPYLINFTQSRGAARKGKRIERARLARLRANERRLQAATDPKQKRDYKKSMKIDKTQMRFLNERMLDNTLPKPPDDTVFFVDKYRKKRFSFDEIIDFHRQIFHPHVLNKPDSLVSATIELNLKMTIKKKKYIEHIDSTLCFPHLFKYEVRPRKIVALSKKEEDQEKAREAGAAVVGGLEVVNLLKTNQLTQRDFNHVVCHTDFLVDFASVKGMKGAPYFPTKQRGNYGDDLYQLVRYFINGIDYSLKKTPDEPEYGFIDCYFGRLNMTNEQLRENLLTLFKHVNRFKPLNLADGKQFFQRVLIRTPDSEEIFLLKFWELFDEYEDPDNLVDEDDLQASKAQ